MQLPTFLRADWKMLAMANYAVDPKLLQPYLPAGTELDTWNNHHYVSLVGFMFLNTRVGGIPVPFHINFEEVNLRFYVRHKSNHGWRRGVVFIREIVPRRALSFVANFLYNENYVTMPMTHTWNGNDRELEVAYRWKSRQWNTFSLTADATPQMMEAGSEEEFITEHYWGYTRISDSITSGYEVTHPPWRCHPVQNYSVDVRFREVYGAAFSDLEHRSPQSVLLAEGSAISVKKGSRIVI